MGYCILTKDTQPHNVSSNFPFLGHLQETFSIQDGQFKKGIHYFVDEHIGSGASGDCYKGSITNDSSIWCIKIVKKVSQPNGVSTFHSKRRNARLLSGGRGCRVGLTFNFNSRKSVAHCAFSFRFMRNVDFSSASYFIKYWAPCVS